MNRRILRLAIPNIISNITIPLLGMIDIAIAGRLGSDAAIGAIAIGATIFGFIYWNCGFIRMGTSGLTAQAFGARNLRECADLLVRAMVVALFLAAIILIFQCPIAKVCFRFMDGSDAVMEFAREYFFARIWAAPATISLYAIHGWFIGMQNSKAPMIVAILMNIVNIVFSLWFVYGFGMGVAGIAWGTVVTQYGGALFSWIIWIVYYRRFLKYVDWKDSLRLRPMLRFFNVNKDIFLRTACNVAVYSFFTVASTGYGDTLLATNSILIQLFTFFSYMQDGFAYAAEALTGRFTGARNFPALKQCIRYMFWWSFGIALLYVLVYVFFWRQILTVFTDSQAILETARQYIVWIVIVPLAGFAPFLMDGIMIGATRTKVLRNSMFLATLVFFALYYSLVGQLGNDALWFAFVVFITSRGILQWLMTDRLRDLYR